MGYDMSIFKKKQRNEQFFYDYLMGLTPSEMMAFSKAMVRYMKEVTQFSTDIECIRSDRKKDKERKEVQ